MYFNIDALDYLYIRGKVERGIPISDEERQLIREHEEEYTRRQETQHLHLRNRPVREAANRQEAIDALKQKFCPHINKNCMGDACAMFKLVERPARFGEDHTDKHYDAMCAFNVPERGSRVER